jgi:uncharacterized integral membrane protein
MGENSWGFMPGTGPSPEKEFDGLYGRYRITVSDQLEVQRYRIALLLCGLSFTAGICQWLILGPELAWLWLLPMATGLGLALNWIHIYLRPLHLGLQMFWAFGCLGATFLLWKVGSSAMLTTLSSQPKWIWAIGPLFAALTGVGFKEFFCFRRPEAVGLTLMVPTALLGYLSGVLNGSIVMGLLVISAALLLIMALRKFGMEAAADVGDKSVLAYLEGQLPADAL